MRIIRVEHGGTSYYGILEDGLVFRLHQQPGHMEPIPLSEAKVLPLVTPSKVVCVGLNYKAHAEELGYPLPNMPSFFLKPPSSIIGNGEPSYCRRAWAASSMRRSWRWSWARYAAT